MLLCVTVYRKFIIFTAVYSLHEYIIYFLILLIMDVSIICCTNNVVVNLLVYVSWCTCVRVSFGYVLIRIAK